MVAGMVVFGGLSIAAFTKVNADQKPRFKEIDVERINIVEPNGLVRMTISDAAHAPGWVIGGKFYPGRPKTAGMIFYNDEGEENGGLIFGGMKDKDGNIQSGGHLSFDQYQQDRVINLDYSEYNGVRKGGLQINDMPVLSMAEMMPKYDAIKELPKDNQDSAYMALRRQYGGGERAYIGRIRDKSSVVRLSDASGKARIQLTVDSAGAASIEFLDANGKVTKRITGEP
jgi:hypothetical protein